MVNVPYYRVRLPVTLLNSSSEGKIGMQAPNKFTLRVWSAGPYRRQKILETSFTALMRCICVPGSKCYSLADPCQLVTPWWTYTRWRKGTTSVDPATKSAWEKNEKTIDLQHRQMHTDALIWRRTPFGWEILKIVPWNHQQNLGFGPCFYEGMYDGDAKSDRADQVWRKVGTCHKFLKHTVLRPPTQVLWYQ